MIETVAELLAQARRVLVITGPGMSIAEGVPAFRNLLGLERTRPEDTKLIEAAMSVETFQRRPEMTWKYLLRMEAALAASGPTLAHRIIGQLEDSIPRVTVLTVNNDRFHQRSGSRNVIEMHGALFDLRCSRCEMVTRHTSFDRLDIPPSCTTCGGVLRPDMPLYGDSLAEPPFQKLQDELDLGFDLVIAVGVTQMYPYLARPILLARAEGLPTVEISEANTDVSDLVGFRIKGNPSSVLAQIWDVCEAMPTRRSRS